MSVSHHGPNRLAPKFTLIAGPTASGKSKLALRLAEERAGVIVNADSMQVYQDLRIVTARPDDDDMARVPHRLYGFRPGEQPYSVAAWLEDVAPLVKEARGGSAPLILVGGTGLYFKALLAGLSPIPDIPDDIREYWRQEARTKGGPELHAILRDRDPAMSARLMETDPQRLVRALEVLDATGRSLLEWQQEQGEPLIHDHEAERLFVTLPRDVLYAQCDARWDRMIDDGALDEVRALKARGLSSVLPVMRAVGVRPLSAFLDGLLDWDAACENARTETRRYAKRQLTWSRKNMITWNVIQTQ